jgi:hypothetical protein
VFDIFPFVTMKIIIKLIIQTIKRSIISVLTGGVRTKIIKSKIDLLY